MTNKYTRFEFTDNFIESIRIAMLFQLPRRESRMKNNEI